MRIDTVGAIVPTFNQAQWLERCLESLVPQCERVVIVNDGSTDETAQIATKWSEEFGTDRVVVVTQENKGTAQAINLGVTQLADVRWITWVSSDNVVHNEWRARLACMWAPDVAALVAGYRRLEPDGAVYSVPVYRGALDMTLQSSDCQYGPAFMIRADVWRAVGKHRGGCAHDYDHWLRVEEFVDDRRLRILPVEGHLVDYYVHAKRRTVAANGLLDAEHWRQAAVARRQRLSRRGNLVERW